MDTGLIIMVKDLGKVVRIVVYSETPLRKTWLRKFPA
jgi:hypothetical protein